MANHPKDQDRKEQEQEFDETLRRLLKTPPQPKRKEDQRNKGDDS